MVQASYYLEQIGDFIFLLCKKDESKNILQKRFKKNEDDFKTLFGILEEIEELGYSVGMDMAYNSHYVTPIKAKGNLSLIEIRVRDSLWRVITYESRQLEKLVMLDAFENHKITTMAEMVKRNKDKIPIVKELLGEGD